jgi:hypothetical protein
MSLETIMTDEMTLAPELIPANVHYMQKMMYLAQGYADWEEEESAEEVMALTDDLEVV